MYCEVTKADIRAICDEAGCDTNQVIGLLLELNILIVKLQDFSAQELMNNEEKEHSILSDLEEEEEEGDFSETFLVPALALCPPVIEDICPHQLVFYLQFSPALPGQDKVFFSFNL